MLDFYTLQETFKMLTESSNSEYTYTSADIATLCRQGALTPVFGYDSYISKPCHHEDDGRPLYAPCDTHKFKGHLTHDHLISLIDGYTDSLSLSVANSLEGERNILLFDRYQKNPQTAELGCITVTQKQIKIAAKEVQSYIASKQSTEQNTPEQQRIAELESQIAELQEQLRQQNSKLPNDTLLTAIHDKSHEHHAPDLSHAIELWNNLYIDRMIGSDSHSNKANKWIQQNTSYGDDTEHSSVKRLRQVSTPLKDFGGQRKR
jgi:DNA-binding transcriptional MerR regulator